MKNIVKEFKLGELFCGPGGLALGATTAKIEDSDYKIIHKWANDYDKDTCNTYTRNICPDDGESVICGDVRKLDIDSLGDIDALAFGFPCNDFSVRKSKSYQCQSSPPLSTPDEDHGTGQRPGEGS